MSNEMKHTHLEEMIRDELEEIHQTLCQTSPPNVLEKSILKSR